MEIKAPSPFGHDRRWQRVFLSGSIEMGTAVLWQDQVSSALDDLPGVMVLNPRREDWDASWVQTIENDQFREQVEWELDALEAADLILVCFDPKTYSPITLLELGLHAMKRGPRQEMIVYCPPGFWRKGNVDILCKRYDIRQVGSMDALIAAAREVLA